MPLRITSEDNDYTIALSVARRAHFISLYRKRASFRSGCPDPISLYSPPPPLSTSECARSKRAHSKSDITEIREVASVRKRKIVVDVPGAWMEAWTPAAVAVLAAF